MIGNRTRTRAEGPVIEDLNWISAVSGANQGHVQCTMHDKLELMEDVVTDNYFRRSKDGEIINNPCEYTVRSSTASGGGSYLAYDTAGNPAQLSQGGSVTLALCAYHNVYAREILTFGSDRADILVGLAKAKALSYVDSTPYAFLEDALEVRETLRFLRSPFKSLRSLSRQFRKSLRSFDKRTPRKLADAISDAWLEYRFAAAPLVRSAMSVHDALADKTMTRPLRLTARGFSKDGRTDRLLIESANGKGFFLDSDREIQFQARAGILYEVGNPLVDFNFKAGLRLKDVPEGLWAVMPYSFMIDRVLDISGAIRGLTALLDPSVTILAGWTTTKSDARTTDRASHQEHPTVRVDITGDPVVTKEFGYSRTPWSPSMSDVLGTPEMVGLVSDATRIGDLAALILSNMGGRRR